MAGRGVEGWLWGAACLKIQEYFFKKSWFKNLGLKSSHINIYNPYFQDFPPFVLWWDL